MTTQVHVRVPATPANLGSGFDTLGLALHNELTLGESRLARA
jgi:homoserine kinase